MRWDSVAAPTEKVLLAQALTETTARTGWARGAFEAASLRALGSPRAWRKWFPRAGRDAIWFISEVSDASMARAFQGISAASMSAVIRERFCQNAGLKPFVRRVMVFDLLHPVQALARMQRTAGVMLGCIGQTDVGFVRLTALNLAYTAIVFWWLFDGSAGDRHTHWLTERTMRLFNF